MTSSEISFLQQSIDEINLLTSSKEDLILIDKKLSLKLNDFSKKSDYKDELTKFVKIDSNCKVIE